MRILFAGTPEPALPSLHALLESGHEVVAVLTRPDAPAGRGRALRPSPVAESARAAGIPVLTPATLRDPEVVAQLKGLGVDAAGVVAYGNLIPPDLLAAFPWVNLHFSLLPRWRGAAPVQRAIAAGDTVTGACAFLIEEGLDTGPIIESIEREIGPRETAGDVLDDLARAGAPRLVRALTSLGDGTAQLREQSHDGVTLAPKVAGAEARVDWTLPAAEIDRRIRAFTPAPGAFSELTDGARIKLGPVTPVADVQLAPGQIEVGKKRVLVGTGSLAVELGALAPAGKSWMDAAAWGRGQRETVAFDGSAR